MRDQGYEPGSVYAGLVGDGGPRLVVLAASAGSLEPLLDMLRRLPAGFPAAMALVQPRMSAPKTLLELLRRGTSLRAVEAADGMRLEPGTVYVCPPGEHVVVQHSLRIVSAPPIDFVRPSGDLLLESVSQLYGDRAIAVVMSGTGSDAALGGLSLTRAGGTVLAQSAATCAFANMPNNARFVGATTSSLDPAEIAQELQAWASKTAKPAPPVPSSTTKVLLVDDHPLFLDGMASLLARQRDMTVVGRVATGVAAIQAAVELGPDVVVMDIFMHGIDGTEATQEILAKLPNTRILALSGHASPKWINAMLRAGAAGYLTKLQASEALVAAIRTVRENRLYLSRDVAAFVTKGLITSLALDT